MEKDNTFSPITSNWNMVCSYPDAGIMSMEDAARCILLATDQFKIQHPKQNLVFEQITTPVYSVLKVFDDVYEYEELHMHHKTPIELLAAKIKFEQTKNKWGVK